MRPSPSLVAVIFGALAATLSTSGVASAQYHIGPIPPPTPLRVIAVRSAPSLGAWVAPGDYDGDGKVDPSVKHDTGEWTIDFSANVHANGTWDVTYGGYGGATGVAAPADYDGDGKADLSVKDDAGNWYIDYASDGFNGWNDIYHAYGDATAHPVPADYDGDGRADLSVKTDAGTWLIDYAADGFNGWNEIHQGYGDATAHPVPADYDGDGRADLSVKTDAGTWLIDYAAGGFGAWNVGYNGYGYADAHPVPADYDGDRRADLSVKTDGGTWYIDYASDGFGAWNASYSGYGYADACPVPADYDGDHRADLAVRGDDGSYYIDYASDGFGAWNVAFNPDLVVIAAEGGVTSQELAEFDSRWMNPFEVSNAEGAVQAAMMLPASTHGLAAHTLESSAWYYTDRMWAMVRMFDMTGDLKYLDHLHNLVNYVVAGQDAVQPDASARLDPFRGKVMHAWGVKRVQYGDFHTSSATVAGLYLYPMAAFARIVAENPGLQATYGADAKAAATAALETYQDFAPELVLKTGANGTQNYLMNPPGYADLLTPGRCVWAEAFEASEDTNPDDVKTFQAEEGQCNEFAKDGGEPMAYNETLIFVSALVELSRALDSSFYAPDAATKALAEQTFPEIAARAVRYYGAALDPMGEACLPGRCTGYYAWNYSGDPAFPSQPDDTEHGQYEMFAMALLSHNESRLDALLAAEPGGPDQLRLASTDLERFANTFLQRLVADNDHLYANQSQGVPSPIDSYDGDIEGWADLNAFNPAVFQPCAASALAQWNPAIDPTTDSNGDPVVVTLQPHLSVGNHAALLAAKASLLP